tara:strand:- start:801 stop:1100 length:300 start_codon:yes stop_codon:yes gene_type:complete
MWKEILKLEDGELEVAWNSKDGKAQGEAFYAGYWGIMDFGHNAQERQGLGEKYLKEMVEYLLSIKEGDIEADGTLPEADGFWDKMLSKNIIQSIRRRGK